MNPQAGDINYLRRCLRSQDTTPSLHQQKSKSKRLRLLILKSLFLCVLATPACICSEPGWLRDLDRACKYGAKVDAHIAALGELVARQEREKPNGHGHGQGTPEDLSGLHARYAPLRPRESALQASDGGNCSAGSGPRALFSL